MGVVDRLNAWVLGRIAANARQGASAQLTWDVSGLTLADNRGSWKGRWADVTEIAAYTRALAAGDVMCLSVAFRDGRHVEFNENMPEWAAFLAALPGHAPLAMSPDRMRVALAADPAARLSLLEHSAKPQT
jgi:hypothetical protein